MTVDLLPAARPSGLDAGFIWLASQSPRRRELLDRIGIRYRPLLPGPEEDAEALEAERAGELPADYALRVTLAKVDAAKARRVARGADDAPILCADTTVALGRTILGKPRDAADAVRILTLLSGRTHRVISVVAVASAKGTRTRASVSRVRFAPMTADEIARYVAGGEPFGKAGAYAVQGAAACWIERIEGSCTGIMGLPLHETAALLREAGVDIGR